MSVNFSCGTYSLKLTTNDWKKTLHVNFILLWGFWPKKCWEEVAYEIIFHFTSNRQTQLPSYSEYFCCTLRNTAILSLWRLGNVVLSTRTAFITLPCLGFANMMAPGEKHFVCWTRIWVQNLLIPLSFREKRLKRLKNIIFGNFWKIVELNTGVLEPLLLSEIDNWYFLFNMSP